MTRYIATIHGDWCPCGPASIREWRGEGRDRQSVIETEEGYWCELDILGAPVACTWLQLLSLHSFPQLLPTTPSHNSFPSSYQILPTRLLPTTPSHDSFPRPHPSAPSISRPFHKYIQQLLPSVTSNDSLPKLLLTNPSLSLLNLNQQSLNSLHTKCISALTLVYWRKQQFTIKLWILEPRSNKCYRWQNFVNNKSVILHFRSAKVPSQVKWLSAGGNGVNQAPSKNRGI